MMVHKFRNALEIKEHIMIKLYGIGFSSPVNKVRYCLNHLGLTYDWEQTNPMQGENQKAEYVEAFPTGKIPAIDVDGFKLVESNAIIRYLATINNSTIYPTDAKKRALVDVWLDYSSIHVGAAMGRVLYNRLFAPMNNLPVDEASLKTGLEFLAKYFPIIEKQLTKNFYLAGKELTIADICLLATLDPCELAKINLGQFPHIIKWRNGLKTQEFYQKCYKDYTQFAQDAFAAKAGK